MTSPWSKPKPERHGRITADPPSCPGCGTVLDAYTVITDPGRQPIPGAVSICVSCGAELQYYGEPLKLRRLDGDELILARADPRFRLAKEEIDKLLKERAVRKGEHRNP